MIIDNINFQTRPKICDLMVSLFDKATGTVLEPTPGKGNLVRALENKGYTVIVPNPDLDVFKFPLAKYDFICMNPPFSPATLGYEILYRCMQESDNIVALMPWWTLINSEKRTKYLIEFGLKSIIHLPRRVFPGTRIQVCIIHLIKGYLCKTQFLNYTGEV